MTLRLHLYRRRPGQQSRLRHIGIHHAREHLRRHLINQRHPVHAGRDHQNVQSAKPGDSLRHHIRSSRLIAGSGVDLQHIATFGSNLRQVIRLARRQSQTCPSPGQDPGRDHAKRPRGPSDQRHLAANVEHIQWVGQGHDPAFGG